MSESSSSVLYLINSRPTLFVVCVLFRDKKPVFRIFGFFLTVFGFGFFQGPPQPTCGDAEIFVPHLNGQKHTGSSKSAAGLLPRSHQADIRMRSDRLLRLDDNKSAASCLQV